ncbi:MAG TPA: cyclic nucleotide-binding domain-containing protein [Anaerolineales bacterium]|nr:cyclic nucleotide-binding domain-containing protein [Anaerolineales bacterium]
MTQDYIERLRDEVEREVMACIGCNDCMLACPLPEKRHVTIAELNAAVLSERITNPNVINFVTACTQCQQCIPVCPADLHRADMVLWNKMKVENVTPNRPMPLQIGSQVSQSNWTLDTLAKHLTSFQLFQGVPVDHLRRMLLSCTLRQLAPGETLCREGEFNERLYVFLEGKVEQSISVAADKYMRILVLEAGTFHGEMGVLGNQEESYNLVALSQAIVLEIPKATVHRLMKESLAFKTTMDELYRRRALWTYACQSPLFRSLPESAIQELLQQATLRVFRAGEVIYREGEPGGDLGLVRSGYLRVARRHNNTELVLQYYREGDIFGASTVLFKQPQPTIISANTRAEVVFIPAESIRNLLDRNQELRARLIEEAYRSEQLLRLAKPSRKRESSPATVAGIQTIQQDISLEDLVDQGVIQGREILVIDTALCTNCNNCVEACRRRHGYSRLERRGLQMGNLLFPTACRHCEDPVCLLCSVNGIVRKPDGEISIVTDNCIGCGACAERCPYGNIQMHTRKPENLLISLAMALGVKKPDPHSSDRVAVKCDLCEGYEDYACVRACPVGAAMRIDPVQVFKREDLNIGVEMKNLKDAL